MKTFIKVTEIWLPNKDRTQLELGSGLYGALTEFKAISQRQQFAYNEGLPGKAWATKQPLILKKFEDSYFKRTTAAQQAGLTCGIALPIFSGDFLLAVVVFLCGDDAHQAGAIEVWSHKNDSNSLSVSDGYYGTLQHFEKLSQQLQVCKGQGLAGLAWESGLPVLIDDIGKTSQFLRAEQARQAGITNGLGIPVADGRYVMTFLSAKATPLAKRIQLWIPDNSGERLLCQQGYSRQNNELAQLFETLSISKGEGALGRVWLSGLPIITGGNNEEDYNPELHDLSRMLAIPIIIHGYLKAIVSFLF